MMCFVLACIEMAETTLFAPFLLDVSVLDAASLVLQEKSYPPFLHDSLYPKSYHTSWY